MEAWYDKSFSQKYTHAYFITKLLLKRFNSFQLKASQQHTVLQIAAGTANQIAMKGQMAHLLQQAGKPVDHFAQALKETEIVGNLMKHIQVKSYKSFI